MRYRRKSLIVKAAQWFKNGDHGDVQRYVVDGYVLCEKCAHSLHGEHGWLRFGGVPTGGFIVCPGDWIVTAYNGEQFPVKPDKFSELYEAV